jgi:hypothetical protein
MKHSPLNKQQNLSKLKKQEIIQPKKDKALDADDSLAENPRFKKPNIDPTNKKLDGEDFLSDMPVKNPKGGSKKKMDGEKSLSDDMPNSTKLKGTNKKLAPENDLANDMKQKKGSKLKPSNSKLDQEKSLAENKHIKGFISFVNENYINEDKSSELKNSSGVPGKYILQDGVIDITLKRNYSDDDVDKIYQASKKLGIDFDKEVDIHS